MKKSIFLFFAAILCAMSVQGAAIKNISSVYIAGTMNNWSSNNSNWYLGSGNYNKKTFYVAKSNSNYEFKLVINGNWYTKDGYWYTNSNSGPFTGLSTSGNNMQIETKNITTSTKYVSLEFEFYGEYSNENRLTIKQSGVDALSPSLTPSSSNLSDGETSTITPSCSGGSGNYDYTYTVTCGGNDMTATTLSTTSGASVVFTAPTASVEKTYTITVTAKDSHALLSDLQATATTDIVVAASVEKTNIVKISYKCDEDDIETATFQEVGVSTASAIAAPVIAGYNFSNWTLGSGVQSADANANPISITTKASGDYTLTANYTEIPKTTVYFVNNKNWSKVNVYGWEGSKGENPGWPGADITANTTGEKIGEFDVYSYTVEVGSYNKIIFNDGSAQTANFLWTDGKYYYMGAATDYAGGTKEDVTTAVAPDPLATEVYLAGDMTEWGANKKEFKKATADATTASVTVNLTAKTYEFQLVIDGTWYGNKSTMQRGGDAVHEGGWSFEDTSYGANCKIVADIAGDYTFTWNLTDKKLTVAYPPLPKYTVTATAENGSVTGAGEYEQGSEATLVATPDAGYAFQNWTKGGEVVSTEATYIFTVTANVELVANFVPEETHEVTVSYLCGGNPIVGQITQTLAVGVTTPSTVSAPAITNYKFDSWTLGTGVQSEDDTKNPIQITTLASGEYTLVANYTKIELTYTVEVPAGTEKCYIAGDMTTEWSFVEMTKVDDTHFTITIEGATTEHKYKYAAGPAWAYVEKKADGSEADDRTYNANDVVKKWASVYDPSAIYLLMGVNGDWDNGIALEVNPHNAAEYRLLCQPIVEANDAIKVVKISKGNKSYCASIAGGSVETESDSNGNIVLADGIYDFYYKIHEEKIYIATATNCYTRDVTEGKYGTICLPKAATNCNGATFFEVVGKEGDKVFFDEVTTLEAGVPYIFLAEANKIVLSQTGESADEAGKSNSLQGTFTQIDPAVDNVLVGNYMVVNNVIKKCGVNCGLQANRAYFIAGELESLGAAPASVPGRKRIAMGTTGAQVATGMENVDASAQPVKTIINGQLFILRGEKMYDAQGKLVK